MSFYGAADLDQMLAEFGVPVEFVDANDVLIKTVGLVDDHDPDIMTAEATTISAHLKILTYKTGALLGLAAGSLVTIEGTQYTVARVRQIDDGALSRAWVSV